MTITEHKRTVPFGRPWITDEDRAAVMAVLEGHILTHGPECEAFEHEFMQFMGGNGRAVTMSSGMAALHLAYFQLGIGSGDEVIVPAQTHIATVHAVEITGARPIFADCELETGCIDPNLLDTLITPRTRAISMVHYNGIPTEMDPIVALAEKHDLSIIEDCALAVGARYKGTHVGLIGTAGIFSFYPVKHITTAEGGMYVSQDAEYGARGAHLRAFGYDRAHQSRKIPGIYDIIDLGLNYRMSEMQAALGHTQLKRISVILEKRRHNFIALKQLLVDALGDQVIVVDSPDTERQSSHYCLTVILQGKLSQQRNDVIVRLNEAGVGTSVYYPVPTPATKYYREKYGYTQGQYPNAEHIAYHSIALPVGPHLEEGDIPYIAEQFVRIIQELS
jgi:perosamine synthetase